jgi:hypothetical protein
MTVAEAIGIARHAWPDGTSQTDAAIAAMLWRNIGDSAWLHDDSPAALRRWVMDHLAGESLGQRLMAGEPAPAPEPAGEHAGGLAAEPGGWVPRAASDGAI